MPVFRSVNSLDSGNSGAGSRNSKEARGTELVGGFIEKGTEAIVGSTKTSLLTRHIS